MDEPLQIQDLLPGDILLYRSQTWIAKAIRLLDGTKVSHAGLWMEDGVAESLFREGLTKQSLDKSIAGCDRVMVMRMEPSPGPMSLVLDIAKKYLADGNRYAYEQIILLAGICLTRKLDLQNPRLCWLVRLVMEKAVDWIEDFHSEGKEPMICSEFVFRAYDEAILDPNDPYSLEILSQKASIPYRHFSLCRLQGEFFFGDQWAESPSVSPDSLLAKLQAKGQTVETLASPSVYRSVMSGALQEDIDFLIQQYIEDIENSKAGRPLSKISVPEVSVDVLLDSAQHLVSVLADSVSRKSEIVSKNYASLFPVTEAPSSSLLEIFADFVTPGDLLKSPSLTKVGVLRPDST